MKKRIILLFIFLFSAQTIFLFVSKAHCQNGTAGDKNGSDNTAYLFAPFNFEGICGEDNYLLHVGDLDSTLGQQYTIETMREWQQPNLNMPLYCNVVSFYNIINNSTSDLGTLLFFGHGSIDGLAIEAYQGDSLGYYECIAQINRYISGTVDPSLPPLRYGYDIYMGQTASGLYNIAIKDYFIRNHGNLNQSLVFIASCHGGYLADDFVYANARFAVGPDIPVNCGELYEEITKFFERMDGYGDDGKYDRRADSAVGDLDTCLMWDGLPNTTLSPCVDSVIAPRPLEVGDSIIIAFETSCDTSIDPDIQGLLCQIENEYWVDSFMAVGFCTWTPNPIAYNYAIKLCPTSFGSANNWSILDGNTNPIGPGIYEGMGPSRDEYTRLFADDESGQKYFVNPYGYRPVSHPVGTGWQEIRPDLPYILEITDWNDDGNSILSAEDEIHLYNPNTSETIMERIDIVTPIMKTSMFKGDAYLEMIDDNPVISDCQDPLGTFWVEVEPDFGQAYQITSWEDYDYSGDLSNYDYILLYALNGPDSGDAIAGEIDEYMTGLITSPSCQGRCGNANGDASVNISDAVYIINYVFVGTGLPPVPILGCGDANGDGDVTVSDAVYLINYAFQGGPPPGDCSPGSWVGQGGDCCPF